MKKKIIVFIVLLSVFGIILFLKICQKQSKDFLTLYGNIEIRQIDLSFQVQGKIEKLLKEEGDTVKKGELLALLDPKDYKVNLDKAIAEVERLSAVKDEALSKYERNAPLGELGAISKQSAETLLNNKNKAQAEYKMALANKQDAQNQLSYTKLYAPDSGIITIRPQEVGSNVAKGQIVYTMTKIAPVWVRAYISEIDLGNIKYGQKAYILTDTINPLTGKNREYEGQIGYISPVAEFTPKQVQSTDTRSNLVYAIRVYVDNIDENLRQGMPTTIKIDLASNE